MSPARREVEGAELDLGDPGRLDEAELELGDPGPVGAARRELRAPGRLLPALALALLALLLAAPAGARTDPELEAGARIVSGDLEAWDTAAARRGVDELARRFPGDPTVTFLQARVLFEEGNYVASADAWESLGPRVAQQAALARTTAKVTAAFQTRESAHFVIRFKPGKDALLVPYALEALEAQRTALGQDLGYLPPGKVRVEVYDDLASFASVSTLSLESVKRSGTIALCKFDRLLMVSPKALVQGYGWIDSLTHEYTHLVISKKSRNTVPIWIHEGLAKFLESRWRGAAGQDLSPASAGLLRDANKHQKLIPFERMHPSMALLPSQEDAALAYAEVFTAIELLHARGGAATLVQLIEALASGAPYEEAVTRASGMPFPRFLESWKAHIAARPVPAESLPLSVEKLRFKEDEKKVRAQEKQDQEELRFGDFLEIEDPQGRKLAHLGELLRERKRPRAAIEEFAKAHGRVGARSPALSNRYAEALIEVGDLAGAEKLLVASLRPFPEVPKTQRNLGHVYFKTGRLPQAEKAFREVISVDPFDPVPHAALVEIYGKRGDTAQAAREKAALQILAGRPPAPDAANGPRPDQGTIEVRSHPYARVVLDGVDTGRSTPTTLHVPPGSHVVRLVNEERGFTRESTVEVNAGEEKSVEITLENEPAPSPKP